MLTHYNDTLEQFRVHNMPVAFVYINSQKVNIYNVCLNLFQPGIEKDWIAVMEKVCTCFL